MISIAFSCTKLKVINIGEDLDIAGAWIQEIRSLVFKEVRNRIFLFLILLPWSCRSRYADDADVNRIWFGEELHEICELELLMCKMFSFDLLCSWRIRMYNYDILNVRDETIPLMYVMWKSGKKFDDRRRRLIGEDDRKHCSGHLVPSLGVSVERA